MNLNFMNKWINKRIVVIFHKKEMRIALFRLAKEIGGLFKLYNVQFYNVYINLQVKICVILSK